MNVRTIAIIRNDNDYGNTFEPLLNSIYESGIWKCGNTDVLEQVIRSGIEFHYLAFQHGRHIGEPGYGKIEDVVRYLSDIRVLFDEEAEKDIEQSDHDSGAWYLETASGQVSAY